MGSTTGSLSLLLPGSSVPAWQCHRAANWPWACQFLFSITIFLSVYLRNRERLSTEKRPSFKPSLFSCSVSYVSFAFSFFFLFSSSSFSPFSPLLSPFSLPPTFFTLFHLRSYFSVPFAGNELKSYVRFPSGGDQVQPGGCQSGSTQTFGGMCFHT